MSPLNSLSGCLQDMTYYVRMKMNDSTIQGAKKNRKLNVSMKFLRNNQIMAKTEEKTKLFPFANL